MSVIRIKDNQYIKEAHLDVNNISKKIMDLIKNGYIKANKRHEEALLELANHKLISFGSTYIIISDNFYMKVDSEIESHYPFFLKTLLNIPKLHPHHESAVTSIVISDIQSAIKRTVNSYKISPTARGILMKLALMRLEQIIKRYCS